MFGAEYFRLVGAIIYDEVTCRGCLEKQLKEEVPGIEVNNDTLLVYTSIGEDRCPIMEANSEDYAPDGLFCEFCDETIFEHTCAECGCELTEETWAGGTEDSWGMAVCDECYGEEEEEDDEMPPLDLEGAKDARGNRD